MAGGVTTTGLKEYDRQIAVLPRVVQKHTEAVARRAAFGLQATVQGVMASRGWTMATETTVEHLRDEHRYRVSVDPRPRKPANLPLWLEYGTRTMVAQPFWSPAVNALRRTYPADQERALQAAYDETVNR